MAKFFIIALVMAVAHMTLATSPTMEDQIPHVRTACQKAGFNDEQTNAMAELMENMPKATTETEKQQLLQKNCQTLGQSGIITPLPTHPRATRERVFTWDEVKYSSNSMKLAYWNDKLSQTANEQEAAVALKNMCVIIHTALQNKPTATLDVMPLMGEQPQPQVQAMPVAYGTPMVAGAPMAYGAQMAYGAPMGYGMGYATPVVVLPQPPQSQQQSGQSQQQSGHSQQQSGQPQMQQAQGASQEQ